MAAGHNALPPQKREAILADIRAGEKSLTQIASDHQVGKATVSTMAKKAGITNAFDRSQTERATQAHAADARARRAKLALELLDDVDKLRQRAWSSYEVVMDSRAAGPQHVTLDLPPLPEVRAAYAAIGVAIDKHTRLDQYDTSDSAADAKSFLGDLAEAFGIANRHLSGEPTETA
jgi:hypothetical protein